jgi:predicted nucleic-acid-binding Zn-ribbon protein
MTKKKTFYQVSVACSNCGYKGKIAIGYGNPVMGQICPNCGCQNLRKVGVKEDMY